MPRVCGPCWGYLGNQLPSVVTWSYDLCLVCTLPHGNISLSTTIFSMGAMGLLWTSKKRRLGVQNNSGSSGPKKLLKIVNVV